MINEEIEKVQYAIKEYIDAIDEKKYKIEP